MINDDDKLEQTLFKILDYQAEHDTDFGDMLMTLCLLNLMGLVNALSKGEQEAASSGTPNMQALLVPLLGLMAGGMGRGEQGTGQQALFNPAMLMSLLGTMGGGQSKGGQPDLSGIIGLISSLAGLGGSGTPREKKENTNINSQPVQREINLDEKKGNYGAVKAVTEEQGTTSEEKEKIRPKSGDVLEWKFGTG